MGYIDGYSIMIPMKLIIVRHGETVANTKRIIQGRESNKLTEKGKDQAKEAGRHLKKHKIDIRKDPTLAQILNAVEVNEYIPFEAFQAVAAILSEIYISEKNN